jgi:hypothetical protein
MCFFESRSSDEGSPLATLLLIPRFRTSSLGRLFGFPPSLRSACSQVLDTLLLFCDSLPTFPSVIFLTFHLPLLFLHFCCLHASTSLLLSSRLLSHFLLARPAQLLFAYLQSSLRSPSCSIPVSSSGRFFFLTFLFPRPRTLSPRLLHAIRNSTPLPHPDLSFCVRTRASEEMFRHFLSDAADSSLRRPPSSSPAMPGPSSSLTSSTSFPDELTSSRRQRGSPTIGSFPSSPTSTSSSPSQAVHRPARPSISLPSALSNSFAPSSPADSLTITSFPRFSSWRTGSGPSSPKVKQAHARSWTLSSLLDYEEKDVKREDDRGGGMKRGLTGSLSSSLNLNLLAGRGGKKGRKRSALVLSFLAASLLLAAYGMLHSSGSTRGLEESSREGKGAGLSSWFSRGRERTGTALPNKGEPDLQHADDKDAIKPLSIDQVLATSRPEIFLPPLDTPTPPPIAPPRSLSSLPRRTPARIVLPIYSLPLPDNFHTTLSILRELTSFSVLLAFPEAVRSSIETAFLGISSAPDFVSWDALPGPHEEDDNGDFLDRCLLTTLLDSNDSNDLSLSAFSSYLFLPPLASLPPPFQLKADLFPLLSYPEPSLSSHYTLSLVGARLSSASLLLIVSPEEPTPAAFGVPPLLVSRQTLRSSIIGLRKELPVWAGLAERINVLNQARPLGRGGAVDIAAWVAEGKGQGELGLGREVSRHSELEAESRLKAQLGYTILDTSSSADQVNVTRRHRALYHSLSTPKTDLGSISLVIPSVSILTNLSPLACTVLGRGHNLRVHLSHPSTLVERQLLRKRSPCELAFDVRLKGRSYEEWVDGTEGEGSQVIIVVDGESGWEKSWIGKGSKGNEEKEPAVVIEIPRSEAEMESAGKIWDWVGTLGITALRRTFTPPTSS